MMAKDLIIGLIVLILLSLGLVGCKDQQNALALKSDQWVDAKDFSKFSEAVTAAAEKTLVIACEKTLDKSIVVPNSTNLMFLKGGKIVKTANFTLRIDGTITSPSIEIFSNFKPGEVTFGTGSVDETNPLWWGAKGDAESDATQAIQCAFDAGQNVYIPKGRYLLNSTLNCTNRTSLIIRGAGSAEGKGTVLIGNTGGIALDLTGSRQMDLRDFNIVVASERYGTITSEANPSTVGILYARSEKVQFVEFNIMTNIGVHLISIPSANNGNGTVAIYNFAAELWRARNVYLEADNGIVFTGYNIFKITSPFAKVFGKYPSMSVCTIDGSSTIRGRSGPCVILDNATRIEIVNAYFAGDGAVKDPFPYAVKVTKAGFFSYALTITGHLERKGGWLYTDINLRGLILQGTGGGGGNRVVHLEPPHGSITNGEIWIEPLFAREITIIDAPKLGAIRNMKLYLGDKQKIFAPGAEFTGNTILAGETSLEDVKKAIEVRADASYMIMAKDAIDIINPAAKD